MRTRHLSDLARSSCLGNIVQMTDEKNPTGSAPPLFTAGDVAKRLGIANEVVHALGAQVDPDNPGAAEIDNYARLREDGYGVVAMAGVISNAAGAVLVAIKVAVAGGSVGLRLRAEERAGEVWVWLDGERPATAVALKAAALFFERVRDRVIRPEAERLRKG